jgi:hypothetical protein
MLMAYCFCIIIAFAPHAMHHIALDSFMLCTLDHEELELEVQQSKLKPKISLT